MGGWVSGWVVGGAVFDGFLIDQNERSKTDSPPILVCQSAIPAVVVHLTAMARGGRGRGRGRGKAALAAEQTGQSSSGGGAGDHDCFALPQQLAGLNAEYLSRVQVWLEQIHAHPIIKAAFVGENIKPLALANGALTAPIDVKAVKNALESRRGVEMSTSKPSLVGAGAVPFAWFNVLQSAAPGVQINEYDLDSFNARDFKGGKLPQMLRTGAVALLDDDAVECFGQTGRLQVVSSFEKLHAPIKQCALELGPLDIGGDMTDARAREWLKLFQSVPIEVWRLSKSDLGTHAFTLREDKKDEAQITQWTTLQRMQMVIRERHAFFHIASESLALRVPHALKSLFWNTCGSCR